MISSWLGHRCTVGETWFRLYWPRLPARSRRLLARPSADPVGPQPPLTADDARRCRDRRRRLRGPLDRLGSWPSRIPDARVVVLEAATCGAGPSGRNAGFVNGFWHRLAPALRALRRRAPRARSALPRRRLGRRDRGLGARAGDRHRLSQARPAEGRDQRRPGRCVDAGGRAPARGSATRDEYARGRRRARRGVAATRRCFAAAPGCRRRRRFSRRGWPWRCAPPCSPARGGDLRAHPRARGSAPSPAPGSWSRPPTGARVRARTAVLAINAAAAAIRPAAIAARGQLDPHDRHRAGPRRARRARLERRRVHLHRPSLPPLLPHHRRRADRLRRRRRAARLRRSARPQGRARPGRSLPGCEPRSSASSRPSAAAGSTRPGAARSTSRRPVCRASAASPADASITSAASPATGSGRRT